jgi:hypothetical protein
MLSVSPTTIDLNWALGESSSNDLELKNNSIQTVAFKVRTNLPTLFAMKPVQALLAPGDSCRVNLMLKPIKSLELENPPKFLVMACPTDGSVETEDLFVTNKAKIENTKIVCKIVEPSEDAKQAVAAAAEVRASGGGGGEALSTASRKKWASCGRKERSRRTEAFNTACLQGHHSGLQPVIALFDEGVDVDAMWTLVSPASGQAWEDSPLGWAVDTKNLPLVRWLLAHGVTVDQMSGYGTTALHLAAQMGEFPLVQALVNAGASISKRSTGSDHWNAIDWAKNPGHQSYDGAAEDRAAVVAWLIEEQTLAKGAMVDQQLAGTPGTCSPCVLPGGCIILTRILLFLMRVSNVRSSFPPDLVGSELQALVGSFKLDDNDIGRSIQLGERLIECSYHPSTNTLVYSSTSSDKISVLFHFVSGEGEVLAVTRAHNGTVVANGIKLTVKRGSEIIVLNMVAELSTQADLWYDVVGKGSRAGAIRMLESLPKQHKVTTLRWKLFGKNKSSDSDFQASKKVDMGKSKLNDGDAEALAHCLFMNVTVRMLKLHYNDIRDAGACACADLLKHNTTINQLFLQYNAIGPKGGRAIAEMLTHNTSLTVLDIGGNLLGGEVGLGAGLKRNQVLQTLYIGKNDMNQQAAHALVEGLKANTVLTYLDVWNNNISDGGGEAFAELLKMNSTLLTLRLGKNNIGGRGAKALVKGLAENSTLTMLALHSNAIGKEAGAALAESLKTNSSLITLDIHGERLPAKITKLALTRVFSCFSPRRSSVPNTSTRLQDGGRGW